MDILNPEGRYRCGCDNFHNIYPGCCMVEVKEEGVLCDRCQSEDEFYRKRELADEIATEEAEDILRIDPNWSFDD